MTSPVAAVSLASPSTTTTTTTTTTRTLHHASSDPISLLDSLDAYTSSRASAAAALGGSSSHSSSSSSILDPVDFLNRHYSNEHLLINHLPSLRMAVHDRMDSLEDRISTALQRQSETSESTRKHVQEAKSSITSLEKRIRLVQEKASQSERAVLEITKDMKRLDCAKRHLQKTITTLKQLHMLVHAVEQLRLACLLKPFPDYKSASQLVDATRLLLKHFDAYTVKVQPMRLLNLKVSGIQLELLKGLVRGFRIVGFGVNMALEMEDVDSGGRVKSYAAAVQQQQEEGDDAAAHETTTTPPATTTTVVVDDDDTMPVMTPQVMAEGTSLIDSLGSDVRADFIQTLCHDHLSPYEELFVPLLKTKKSIKQQHSFKIAPREADLEKPPYSLDQVDRRFAWYRRTLRDVCDKFPNVFPTYWNFQHGVTVYFLEKVREATMMYLIIYSIDIPWYTHHVHVLIPITNVSRVCYILLKTDTRASFEIAGWHDQRQGFR